jgi:hypothetical protein
MHSRLTKTLVSLAAVGALSVLASPSQWDDAPTTIVHG